MLSTLHPDRGLDAVPVVYAVAGDDILVPVDAVKAKRSTRLQRVRQHLSPAPTRVTGWQA